MASACAQRQVIGEGKPSRSWWVATPLRKGRPVRGGWLCAATQGPAGPSEIAENVAEASPLLFGASTGTLTFVNRPAADSVGVDRLTPAGLGPSRPETSKATHGATDLLLLPRGNPAANALVGAGTLLLLARLCEKFFSSLAGKRSLTAPAPRVTDPPALAKPGIAVERVSATADAAGQVGGHSKGSRFAQISPSPAGWSPSDSAASSSSGRREAGDTRLTFSVTFLSHQRAAGPGRLRCQGLARRT